MLTKIYSSGEKRGEKNATYTTKKKKKNTTQPQKQRIFFVKETLFLKIQSQNLAVLTFNPHSPGEGWKAGG